MFQVMNDFWNLQNPSLATLLTSNEVVDPETVSRKLNIFGSPVLLFENCATKLVIRALTNWKKNIDFLTTYSFVWMKIKFFEIFTEKICLHTDLNAMLLLLPSFLESILFKQKCLRPPWTAVKM